MNPPSATLWGITILVALCEPSVAAPGGAVPGFQVVTPPRVVLQPVAPRAMTPATRAALERRRRDGHGKPDRGGVYGGGGGAITTFNAPPAVTDGGPDPYVVPGPRPAPACIGPGPLIIEVGEPQRTPTNLPRVVYGTPTPRCPGY